MKQGEWENSDDVAYCILYHSSSHRLQILQGMNNCSFRVYYDMFQFHRKALVSRIHQYLQVFKHFKPEKKLYTGNKN